MLEIIIYFFILLRTHPGALGGACEPIKIEACQLWGYNETSMPNLANHVKQADAKVEFDTFAPLMDSGCSNELPFFLCAIYTPMCAPLFPSAVVVGPCRPLCEKVRANCEPLLNKMGFSWPQHFECSLFHPENKEHEMCMKGPGESATLPRLSISTLHTFRTNHLFRERVKQHLSSDSELNHKYKDYVKLLETDLNMRNPATTTHSECRHLKRSTQYRRVERLGTCIPLCDQDIFFDGYQKNFAVIWMTVWSSLCLGSTLFTLVTYCLDPEQFKFPEKSVIFITFCYSLHALGYVFRLLGGRDAIACQSSDEDPNISLLTQEGLRNEYCVVNALLLFYPFHAASTWWTIGTFTWLLSRFDLLVENYAPIYHLYAWGLPALLSVASLVWKKIDASELTGMCSIGNQNEDNLLFFIIIPEALQFGLNIIFFLLGLIVSSKNKKIYSKIGVFWILYTLPKACVIGCISYEYLNRGAWLDVTKINRPNVEIFMLHICMSLVIGITTCYWIWSEQTFNNWKNIGRSCLGFWKRDKQPPTPTFPTVRYRPQPGDGCSAVATTTKLPVYPTCSIGGSIQIGHQPSIRSSPVVL
ncbi:frizzled-4-like isoform X2 [Lepeophtheirus salmonis]|uniref:frizzled-4-like isoform X2 n=1 Tax=Lepeophtheirus salmonis TaxID=72036 RepID=UPI001AE7D73B|nr:frizzled-4-like isoform X2 [Lepeophtheirus salmonis]